MANKRSKTADPVEKNWSRYRMTGKQDQDQDTGNRIHAQLATTQRDKVTLTNRQGMNDRGAV